MSVGSGEEGREAAVFGLLRTEKSRERGRLKRVASADLSARDLRIPSLLEYVRFGRTMHPASYF